jgi:hypothetical protein
MNKLIDWVKSNKKKAVSAAVITLGGIAGYFVASSSGREEVFNGRVGDWNVVYPKKSVGTRISITRENGKRIRIAKKSGAVIGK